MNIGIYYYKNLINGKIYVGQSIDLKRRIRQHERSFRFKNEDELDNKDAVLLWRAVNKYGRNNFSFEILETCTEEELNRREEFYIENMNSHFSRNGYNITWGGDKLSGENHPFYGKRHTEESLKLIRNAAINNNGMMGKNHTEESKRKISERLLEINKEKNLMRIPKPIRPKRTSVFEKVKELLERGLSQKEIAELLRINHSTVSRIKNNKYPR
jgi:group I intron endonuclease